MDLDELRRILRQSRVSVFDIIDTAINLASSDHSSDFKDRRPGIVDKLYTVSTACRNCAAAAAADADVVVGEGLMATPPRREQEEEEEEEGEAVGDSFGVLFDDDDVVVDDVVVDDVEDDEDEETRVLRIKDCLEHPNQTEDSLVELLQTLADMDITFKALKETDIGRHVNRLRKHPSNDVRILVKQLVRKWKDLVDEWVKVNTPDEHTASTLIGDGDSPQPPRRNTHNGHHQVSEFAYSPNPHNGNNSESELKPKVVPRRDSAIKPPHSANASASAPPKFQRQQRDSSVDQDRLDSARKRLHENYQDAQNAKKQRKIQVMDIHEIPKPKNGYIARNKGGPHGRHR